MRDIAAVEFISASTAGVVNVGLGFEPDAWIHVEDHGGTNPNIRIGLNNARFTNWASGLALLITGSTGVITRDTSSATIFTGGNTLAADETANSDPKHVDRSGNFGSAGDIIAGGLAIPAGDQTNSGRNVVIAFRGDK